METLLCTEAVSAGVVCFWCQTETVPVLCRTSEDIIFLWGLADQWDVDAINLR